MGTVGKTLITIVLSCAAYVAIMAVFHWFSVRRIPGRERRKRADARRRKLGRHISGWARWAVIAGCGVMGLGLVPMVIFLYLDIMLNVWTILVPFATGQAIVFVAAVFMSRRGRVFFRHLEDEGFGVCPDCGYSLAGHAEGGHCPECGYTFTPESLIEDWRDVYKISFRRWPEKRSAHGVDRASPMGVE